ncbi:MAG: PTS sugar transporter subunit IIB [Erysipelotrichaceae bacterium]|nr:PTS sugar transporter subunit IIB [Erysipelotrichaceae bacterium]
MSVELYKLDERMLHGQVVSTFGRILKPDEFIVVNEGVSKDENARTLLELALPGGAEFDCVSPKTYAKINKENDYWGTKTFVVFRRITDVVESIENGAVIPWLNCAGFYQDPNATEHQENYGINLWITETDKKHLRWLEDHGVELRYQVAHTTPSCALKDKVKY